MVFPVTSPNPKSIAFAAVEDEVKFLKTLICVVPVKDEVFSSINEPVLLINRSVPNVRVEEPDPLEQINFPLLFIRK